MNVKRLFDAATANSDILSFIRINGQILAAHVAHISTDSLLLLTDLLALTDTWINVATSLYMNICQLVYQLLCARRVGAVAVYNRIDLAYSTILKQTELTALMFYVGDIIVKHFNLLGRI